MIIYKSTYKESIEYLDFYIKNNRSSAINIVKVISNFLILESGNNNLTLKVQYILEHICSLILIYSFLIHSISGAKEILTSSNLLEKIESILDTEIENLIDSKNKEISNQYYLLKNECLSYASLKSFKNIPMLLTNLIRSNNDRKSNFNRAIIKASDYFKEQ